MKFNESWLREFVNPPLSAEAIGERLTMAGLELDAIELAAPPFHGVIVARIDAIAPHPDADKLKICQVNTGRGELQQVVCGGANARENLVVALATVGAELPGGFKIKPAKLRGVASNGMLCSAAELGLAESSEGILELPEDAPLGEDLRVWLDLDDKVLEVDLTPNRADCLSVRGIARELSVLTDTPAKMEVVPQVKTRNEAMLPVTVEAPQACPRYVGRVIKDIDNQAATPLWMQERLRRCGLRSLHPVVDVTNYVMLELGQPMHAFDLSRLQERIVVRMAEPGEQLTLLDGKEIVLDANSLVIADQQQVLALAGVMGGAASGVDSETQHIFLESAFFKPEIIAGKARGFGLHTDSSHRFERGVDFELQAEAIERATDLIVSICGGAPGPITEKFAANELPELPAIPLRRAQVQRVLGITLPDEEVERILRGLGCRMAHDEAGWLFTPPSYRFDLRIEVDLLEELARIYGYAQIPAQSRQWEASITPIPEAQLKPTELKRLLVDLGYQEAVTYSFLDAETEQLVSSDGPAIPLANPISADLAVMRTSLLGGLLSVIRHNARRQQPRVRIFETGMVFIPDASGLQQINRIAGAITATAYPEQWSVTNREPDFYDLKGDVERLLQASHLDSKTTWRPCEHPALHPGQAASLWLEQQALGVCGQLHPQIQQQLEIDQRVFVFELRLDPLLTREIAKFQPLSKFPAVRRDLALVVDEAVTYAEIEASIRAFGNPLVSDFEIFDVYRGKGVANGRKSLALRLILQDLSRTLGEEEVESTVNALLDRLQSDVGASLRD